MAAGAQAQDLHLANGVHRVFNLYNLEMGGLRGSGNKCASSFHRFSNPVLLQYSQQFLKQPDTLPVNPLCLSLPKFISTIFNQESQLIGYRYI